MLRGVACAALLLSACGPEAPAAPVASPPRTVPGTPAIASSALTLQGPGAPAHELYAEKGISCDACHPCGKRLPGGHEQPWMDAASAAFHAFSANSGLQGCTVCHGPALDGVGGSVSISCAQCHGAAWRTDCTFCHGDAGSAAPPQVTWGREADPVRAGAHAAHLGATHGLSGPVSCETCHVVPSDALSPGHADGLTATVTFTGLALAPGLEPGWDRATATCASTYCHGGTLAGGTSSVPVWTRADGTDRACTACHGAPPPVPHPGNSDCGACHPGYSATTVAAATHVDGKVDLGGAGLTCSSCHGGAANAAPPHGTRGETETSALAVGAHQSHVGAQTLSGAIGCETCHPVPVAMQHADGDVQTLPSIGWSRATASCANACHGTFEPVWTRVDGSQGACGTCHLTPPPAPHTPNPACGNCHDGFEATSVNAALHLNGAIDVQPLTCRSCHGSAANAAPPLGTGGETEPTVRAVGAHQAHLTGGSLSGPVACEECHASVPTEMTHADGLVQLGFGPRAHAGGAQPDFLVDTLTCNGTYCHGSTLRSAATGDSSLNLAPLWTGGPGQAACGSCHLTPPPLPHPRTQLCDGCHPGYSLTHVNLATHLDGVIQAENMTCWSCHGDETRVLVSGSDGLALAAPPFGTRGEDLPDDRSVGAHQAHVNRGDGMALPAKCVTCHSVPTTFDHADGSTVLSFGGLATMGDATPSFDGTTCSSTYCHGSTLGRGGTSHTPTWTAQGPLACDTCHGAPPPLPHPQDADCIRCHPGYTATSARRWTHVNGISDFPSSCNACHDNPPNSGEHYEHIQEKVTCSRCHGTGYSRTTVNETLHRNARQDVTVGGWDPARRTCSSANGCHGSEYWGRTGISQQTGCNRCHGTPPRSGEHEEHKEYACSRCHGAGYTTQTVDPAKHMNGTVDMPVTFYSSATLTCSSQSCHGSEHWGSRRPVTANCGACHGFPPVAPHPQRTACHDCHPSMAADGTLAASHNDGALDLSGEGCATCHGYPPAVTRTGALHTTDQNCYGCHSTTVDAGNAVVANGTHNDGAVQVGGGGVGTYGCQSCHGDQARTIVAGGDPHVKSAPPTGTRGETLPTQRAVGAHEAHLNRAAGLSTPLACGECHPVPTAMNHANGSTVFTWGPLARTGGANPAYAEATLTCSSTYCHGATLAAGGTNQTPAWTGGASQAACGTCHGAPPPAPHTASTSCGGCHAGYTATTTNAALHVNGTLDVNAQTCGSCHAIPPPAPHTASTSCGSCHEGYTATTTNAALHVNGTVDVSAQACGSCHAIPPPAPHTTSTSCGSCHEGYSATSVNEATHADGTIDVSGCTSCHGKAAGSASPAAPLDAAPPVDTLGASTGLRVGAHQKHLLGGAYANATPCATCHAGVAGYASGHANGVNEVGFTGGANANLRRGSWTPRSGSTAGRCGATWCHGAVISRYGGTVGGTLTAPYWNGTTTITSCSACHTVSYSSLPGRHSRHSRYGCGECHAGYTSSVVNKSLHVNGVKNVSGNRINSWSGTSCSTSCHGSEQWY